MPAGRPKNDPLPTQDEINEWTPPRAIEWLIDKANRIRFGKNEYMGVLHVVRSLLTERGQLLRKVEKLEAEVAALQKLKTRRAFDTGGDGTWGGE